MSEVKLYSKEKCMQCKMTRKWLDEHQVEYQYVDIEVEQDERNILQSLGFQTVPILQYVKSDGKTDFIKGFAPNLLKNMKEGI